MAEDDTPVDSAVAHPEIVTIGQAAAAAADIQEVPAVGAAAAAAAVVLTTMDLHK